PAAAVCAWIAAPARDAQVNRGAPPMPAFSVIREARGNHATYLVSGRFEGASAWDLAGRLSAEKLPGVTIDFSRCDEFPDYAVAVIAQAMVGSPGRRFQLRGLRQHQEHVFRCFGVEVGEQGQAVARAGTTPIFAAGLSPEVG